MANQGVIGSRADLGWRIWRGKTYQGSLQVMDIEKKGTLSVVSAANTQKELETEEYYLSKGVMRKDQKAYINQRIKKQCRGRVARFHSWDNHISRTES